MNGLSDCGWPVRVWIGYALEALRQDGRRPFLRALGEVFMPATVQCMSPGGLTAYLPAVPATDPDPLVPDEVALVCYRSRDAYHQACTLSVGGRAYVRLHETLFRFEAGDGRPASHSGFPLRLNAGAPLPEQGYVHLFGTPVDWGRGSTQVQIAVYDGTEPGAFREALRERLLAVERDGGTDPDGVIVALSGRLLVVWLHSPQDATTADPLAGLPLRTVSRIGVQTVEVPGSPAAPFPGIEVREGRGFNVVTS